MKLIVICILSTILQLCENYQILGLFAFPGKSHMILFERLMKKLAAKGHEVDVVSHFPLKEPVPRYNDISIRGTMPVLTNNVSIAYVLENFSNPYETWKYVINAGINMCQTVVNSNVGRNLIHATKKYDLVITQIFGVDCLLGFAHDFKIPIISILSTVDMPSGGIRVGNPDNPSYIPNIYLPYLTRMNFMESLTNTVLLLAQKLGYEHSLKNSNAIAHEFFGPELPSIQNLAHNTNLMFVNSHFTVNYARPTVPNFIEVSGFHVDTPKPLPKHFEDILTLTPKYKGIIYLSMRSVVLTETLPSLKLKALFEAFRKLPYKVLWKATKENFPKDVDIPPNVHFESWIPQLDILCHPNIRLFVTHGGLLSTLECIYCGIPRLGIPLFADQKLNLKESEARGIAISVGYVNVTNESITEALKTLLENPRYKSKAEEVSRLFRDRPLSAMDTAIYWIEYVIKHNGAPHLRSLCADLSWHQYYLVDAGIILLLILSIFLLLIYYVASYMVHKLL